MGEKRRKLYKFISSIAAEAVDNHSLNERIRTRFPDVSNKQIMKASLLAFNDRRLADQSAFLKICDLAISKRSLEFQEPVSGQSNDPEAGQETVASFEQAAPISGEAGDQKHSASIKPAVIKIAKPRTQKQKTLSNGISPT